MINLYGYFFILYHKIHYVTFVGIITLAIVYFYKLQKVKPIHIRLLSTGLYVFGALVHYEIMWHLGWMFHWRIAALDFVVFFLCEYLLIHTIKLMRNKYEYDLPQLNLHRWVVLTLVMIPMIGWLYYTGFYHTYKLVLLELSTENPHNLAWAVGKIICLLSWIFMVRNSKLGENSSI